VLQSGHPELGIARVAVDVPLSHLDRPYDYAVTAEQDAAAVPGARVRVRFSGRLCDGFILDRVATTEHVGSLAGLHKIISSEPVLTAEVATLIRRVADHYAGTFADVMRLAIPPRHAATERAKPVSRDERPTAEPFDGPLGDYPTGGSYLQVIRDRGRPRAFWQVTPTAAATADWAAGLAQAARACVESGRGAVLVVPDQRDLAQLERACAVALGPAAFAVLVAEAGPAARYRAFLAALRGDVRVVIGNRAAAFAPVRDLGLVALWDDGDDLLSEQRAPYPHAREVLALRAAEERAAVLFAAYGRTAEIQSWLERGWLAELGQDRVAVRHDAPRIKITADSDLALERDPQAKSARLPHEVFELVRAALPQGPVLVQVPRSGYLVALVCQGCREPARCRFCAGPTRVPEPSPAGGGVTVASCSWCGRPQAEWECPICGSRRTRSPVVGSARTAEELGRAFPNTPVRQSAGGDAAATVSDTAAIVVATPGAEPSAAGGYAAAVLLDTPLLLLRPDLRAAEEALRRWLNAVALVRGGFDGGSVIAVGESSSRALQALVRVDPGGFAARELAERVEAGFPPAVTMVVIDGQPEALEDFRSLVRLPESAEVLGPSELASPLGSQTVVSRLTLRAPRSIGAALVRAVKEVAGVRSARKSDGALRIRVDPVAIG
jgi:primosomal protein N' (replication factor Y) (superfamily II helicase)